MTNTTILGIIIGAVLLGTILTITITQNNAEAKPLPKAVCPPQFVMHWDKIIFKPILPGVATEFISPEGETQLVEGQEFDIKVLDDPDTVADLRLKTADKLNELGYKTNAILPFFPIITPGHIEIVDVEYSIICAATPDPPIVR